MRLWVVGKQYFQKIQSVVLRGVVQTCSAVEIFANEQFRERLGRKCLHDMFDDEKPGVVYAVCGINHLHTVIDDHMQITFHGGSWRNGTAFVNHGLIIVEVVGNELEVNVMVHEMQERLQKGV